MAYKNKSDRDYKHEYATYQGKPEQIKNRAKRNAARAKLEKEGRVHKGDGRDVDHKRPLSKGGSASTSNLRVKSVHANRSYKRRADRKPA
jgi:hypothetical protein